MTVLFKFRCLYRIGTNPEISRNPYQCLCDSYSVEVLYRIRYCCWFV